MPAPSDNGASQTGSNGAGGLPEDTAAAAAAAAQQQQPRTGGLWGWLHAQQAKSAEGRQKLAALGLAAVLAYGASPPAGAGGAVGSGSPRLRRHTPHLLFPAPAPAPAPTYRPV